jgi:hypothetical protein
MGGGMMKARDGKAQLKLIQLKQVTDKGQFVKKKNEISRL